jgi:predicted RNA-binding protein with PIN domain
LYFFIDGYNLLFHESEEKGSLQKRREKLIEQLHAAFSQLNLKGTVVFDGSRRGDEESGLSYQSPLNIAYAPKGQSADEYIVEQIQSIHNRKTLTIVTNDKGLARHAKAAGTHTQSNRAFLSWLVEKAETKKTKQRPLKESPKQIERLTKIFEQKFLEDTDYTNY